MLNSNLNLLEDFSPNRTADHFNWIPQGLYYDLFDNRNDNLANPPRVLLNDNVSTYTNQQFFNEKSNLLTASSHCFKTVSLYENPTALPKLPAPL